MTLGAFSHTVNSRFSAKQPGEASAASPVDCQLQTQHSIEIKQPREVSCTPNDPVVSLPLRNNVHVKGDCTDATVLSLRDGDFNGWLYALKQMIFLVERA